MAYFRATGGAGGASGSATITVTYGSQFYNKTMTCTKGSTTYTKTTTSSGSTTFSVREEGTWTITCNGVSRQVDITLNYITQMTITKTVTIYSAASDTVSFTDATGAKTVTTNTSGQGSVSITFIPNSTITFTSSKAKNPNNLSQAYSKTITMTDSITTIKVMPDGAIYWYGYGYDDADAKTAGWDVSAYTGMGYSVGYCTQNTNNMIVVWPSTLSFFGSRNAGKATDGTIKVIAYMNTGSGIIYNTNAKNVSGHSYPSESTQISGTSRTLYSLAYHGSEGYRYVEMSPSDFNKNITVEACWIE